MQIAEMKQFQAPLRELQDRLITDVSELSDEAPEALRSAGDLSNVPQHPADRDIEGYENDLRMLDNEKSILQQVDEALERIERGTYGTCTRCGSEIHRERLEAIPYTPYCIRCAEEAGPTPPEPERHT